MSVKFAGVIVLFSLLSASAFARIVDYAGTKPDPQTVRVVSDDVLWDMTAALEKKTNTQCKIVLSETVNVENPHWLCLNNQTCSYAVRLFCYHTNDSKNAVLRIEVSGLDDTKEAKVQDFTVFYLQNN